MSISSSRNKLAEILAGNQWRDGAKLKKEDKFAIFEKQQSN